MFRISNINAILSVKLIQNVKGRIIPKEESHTKKNKNKQ